MLLSLEEFKSMFSITEDFVATDSSSVYLGDNYVVKISDIDWILPDIVFSSVLSHPNILSAQCFCFEEKEGKITGMCSFPKGIEVLEKVKTIDDIRKLCQNILQAMLYMQSTGCIHGDIKPDNIIYLPEEDKYALIDLGMCKRIVMTDSGPSVEGLSYTLGFRDFQFMGDLNKVSCETFAFGQTIRCISLGLECIYDSSFDIEKFVEFCSHSIQGERYEIAELGRFINSAICSPESRSSIQNLLSSPFFKEPIYSPPRIEELPLPVLSEVPVSDEDWYSSICKLLFQNSITLKLNMEGFFLIVHNIHRTPKTLKLFKLDIVMSVHIYLVTRSLRAPVYSDFSSIKGDSIKVMTSILKEMNYIVITRTKWNYCKNTKELVESFKNLVSKRYIFSDVGEISVRHCLCSVNSFMSILRYNSQSWRSLKLYLEGNSQHSEHIFKDLEKGVTNEKIRESVKKNVENAVRQYFDPEEDNGFIYNFLSSISSSKEASNAVIRKIYPLHINHIERYYKFISKTRLVAIKALTKLRLSELCRIYNMLTCEEYLIR